MMIVVAVFALLAVLIAYKIDTSNIPLAAQLLPLDQGEAIVEIDGQTIRLIQDRYEDVCDKDGCYFSFSSGQHYDLRLYVGEPSAVEQGTVLNMSDGSKYYSVQFTQGRGIDEKSYEFVFPQFKEVNGIPQYDKSDGCSLTVKFGYENDAMIHGSIVGTIKSNTGVKTPISCEFNAYKYVK
ncbi:MAG: hypothetical protein RR653_12080 [Clostridia bacterium]